MAMIEGTRLERLLTHGVLVCGAFIFAFPLIWMVGTSIKIRRETQADKLRILPSAPRPQWTTPSMEPDEFKPPVRPDGIPEPVWRALRPRLEAQLAQTLEGWSPRTRGPEASAAPAAVEHTAYLAAMTRGVLRSLGERISDQARQQALEFERARRAAARQGPLGDAQLVKELSNDAIESGVATILADARRLVTPQLLRETFDDCYRRFCLGGLKVRTRDYQTRMLFSGTEWRVEEGPATLVARLEEATAAQEGRLHFTPEQREAAFTLTSNLALSRRAIDRIYVSYRGDASWARVRFEVICDGLLYRGQGWANLGDKEWIEQELRWPEDMKDPLERRTQITVLEPAGRAPAQSPPFAVRVRLEKLSLARAWADKVLANYKGVFKEVPFLRYVMTSVALTLINVTLMIFSSTLAAYAFARLRWPGRELCFGILLATMMIPGQVTMIPAFLVMRWLGWYNSLVPLWIYSLFGSAFFIFLLRQFFKNIPLDLEDAARIDGCGFLRIYWHVMLPLVKPTIATIAIYTFMGVWNDFMGPLIYINDERLFPLALGLFRLSLRAVADMPLTLAGSCMMTLPIIVLFFFAQRYFIQGISLTGVKG